MENAKSAFKQEESVVKQYDDLNDKELNEVLDFCRKRRFIQISEHVRDEEFFK
jgi:hypothetical protein